MNTLKRLLLLSILITQLFSQAQLSNVADYDYFNGTRYSGARNIARTTDGNLFVIFEPAAGYTDGNMEVHYVTFNSFFNEWDPPVALSQSSNNATGIPAIVADENGSVYASWKELNGTTGKRDIMFSKWESGVWSTPVIGDDMDNNAGVQTINMGNDGTIYSMCSIWNDPPQFDPNIYVNASTDGGQTWSTTNLTAVYPTPGELPFNYMDVDLTPYNDTGMMAVWEDKPLPETNQYEIMASVYAPGSGWSLPEIISPILDGVDAIASYVDGVTPRSEAVSIYQFGPADYALAGQSAVTFYDNGTSKVLATTFNPYYQFPLDTRDSLIVSSLNFMGISTSDSILFVDDDNKWDNENVVTDVLDNLGYSYATYDCGNLDGMALSAPTSTLLANYELVIWFTGDDLDNLAFWNIADEDNAELETYLNTANSKLWVFGRDWIYDRYGLAGVDDDDTFAAGDFIYDYVGIASYDSQTWTDDDGVGVTQLTLMDGTGYHGLNPLGWGNAGTRQGEPSVATDASGKVHMAYYDANNHGGIMYRKYDGSWSEGIRLDISADTMRVQRPNIAVDADNGIYVVWLEETGQSLYNVMAITSPDGGVNWNPPYQLSQCDYVNASGYSVKNPSITRRVRNAITMVGFEGGADVVWTEAQTPDQVNGMGYNIKYARIPYVGGTATIDDNPRLADNFTLSPVYPNPFNASFVIPFSLATPTEVKMSIYDVSGREIKTILNQSMEVGEYSYTVETKDLASGIYLLKMDVGLNIETQKVVLLK